tara:strand:- start:3 stop:275 length:273 start_codon:yes stop_codon:yes gene_type:complete
MSKVRSPDYYPSNIVGLNIVNACTGSVYKNCKVGSIQEKNFYRVIDSSGYYNTNGFRSHGNITPNKLFYDNQEQYIEHCLLLANKYKKRV